MFDINQFSPNGGNLTTAYLLFTLITTMIFTTWLSFKTEILRIIPIKSPRFRGLVAGLALWPIGLWTTAKPPRPPVPVKVVKLALRPGPFLSNTFYTVDSIVTNKTEGIIDK